MAVTLITEPRRTIGGVDSATQATLSQTRFVFEREDAAITTIATSGSNFVINFATGAEADRFIVGDKILVNYTATAGQFEDNSTVLVVGGLFIEILQADLSETPIAQSGSYVNNLSVGWRLRVVLEDTSMVNLFGDNEFFYTSSQSGDIVFTVHQIMASLLFELWRAQGVDFIGVTSRGLEYILAFEETGLNVPTPSLTRTDSITAVLARKAALREGGANMFRHLLDAGLKEQILTVFDEPRAYANFSQSISYIIDDRADPRIGNLNVFIRFTPLDINKVIIGAGFSDSPERSPTTDIGVIEELIIGKTQATDQEYVRAQVFVNPAAPSAVSDAKDFRVFDTSVCFTPIMVSWLNELGGIDHWVFDFDQTFNWTESPADILEAPIIDDLEFEGAIDKPLTLRANARSIQEITLTTEGLTFQQLSVLQYLKHTPIVELWLEQNGSKRIIVRVSGGFDTTTTTRGGIHTFAVTLAMPKDFDFSKEQEYLATFPSP